MVGYGFGDKSSGKVEPEEAGWWINLAYATRRAAEVHIEKIRDGILSFSVLPK